MGEELKSISLCLLDDVNLKDTLELDEFKIYHPKLNELQTLLGEGEAGEPKAEICAQFPWARLEQQIPAGRIATSWDRLLHQLELSWAHAGMRSWYPFDELLQTLNLLKPAGGPVIARQFYYWLEPLAEADRRVDRVTYGEPLWDYDDPNGESIQTSVSEYALKPCDVNQFSQLRTQLAQCLKPDRTPEDNHLRTAINYFENADRKLAPKPLAGSFDAIEPLMSYEAALEALLIAEDERGGIAERLSERAVAVMGKKEHNTDNVENFTRRVFCLRSKVAHGVRPIKEIEDLIVYKPNSAIPDAWGERTPIPDGDYKNLLIKDDLSFPGFLVNVRELTRICIRFFCDALSQGQDKATVIGSLDEAP